MIYTCSFLPVNYDDIVIALQQKLYGTFHISLVKTIRQYRTRSCKPLKIWNVYTSEYGILEELYRSEESIFRVLHPCRVAAVLPTVHQENRVVTIVKSWSKNGV